MNIETLAVLAATILPTSLAWWVWRQHQHYKRQFMVLAQALCAPGSWVLKNVYWKPWHCVLWGTIAGQTVEYRVEPLNTGLAWTTLLLSAPISRDFAIHEASGCGQAGSQAQPLLEMLWNDPTVKFIQGRSRPGAWFSSLTLKSDPGVLLIKLTFDGFDAHKVKADVDLLADVAAYCA